MPTVVLADRNPAAAPADGDVTIADSLTRQAVTPRIFEGRVAVVTGGTRGIGAAITSALAGAGAHVAAGFNRDADTAGRMRDELMGKGGSVSVHQGNVGLPADCDRVIADVLGTYGRVDFLVNNAGVTLDKTVRRMSVDDWHAVMRINISGAFYMIKSVLDHMLERGSGRIVNVSSVIGQTGNIGQANYAASKAALFGLSQSLALETARKGITVNCVAPGFIETEMVSAIPEEILKGIVDKVPVRRLGRPDEVARVVRFLLEDEASYITGAVYAVNGGLF
jgi:acetoacetyl-CoA reductase